MEEGRVQYVRSLSYSPFYSQNQIQITGCNSRSMILFLVHRVIWVLYSEATEDTRTIWELSKLLGGDYKTGSVLIELALKGSFDWIKEQKYKTKYYAESYIQWELWWDNGKIRIGCSRLFQITLTISGCISCKNSTGRSVLVFELTVVSLLSSYQHAHTLWFLPKSLLESWCCCKTCFPRFVLALEGLGFANCVTYIQTGIEGCADENVRAVNKTSGLQSFGCFWTSALLSIYIINLFTCIATCTVFIFFFAC